MSRLDDELRNAFRREPPATDFTERLLARVAQLPKPKPRWWQSLATLLEPPRLRWVAIGVTALLLLAIGAAQYSRLHRVVVTNDNKLAEVRPNSPDGGTSSPPAIGTVGGEQAQVNPAGSGPTAPKQRRNNFVSSTTHRLALARLEKERELRVEGEAAKEKVMLALYIASSALNDAEKAIHNDGPKP